MIAAPSPARYLAVLVALALAAGGCDGEIPFDLEQLRGEPAATEVAAEPTADAGATELPPPEMATPEPSAEVTSGPTAEPPVVPTVPPVGAPLPAEAWRTVVHAPGLPDMDPAIDLGPTTQFVVVADTPGLDTLRSELLQPANAWVAGIATDTLLVGVLLGTRVGEGHDVRVVGLGLDDNVVDVAVEVTEPSTLRDGPLAFPLHLVALDRAALPDGELVFTFRNALARAPEFESLVPLPPGAGLARAELMFVPVGFEERAEPEEPDASEAESGDEVGEEPAETSDDAGDAQAEPGDDTGDERVEPEDQAPLLFVWDAEARFRLAHDAGWRSEPPPTEDGPVTWVARLERGTPEPPGSLANSRVPPAGARLDIGVAEIEPGTDLALWLAAERPVDEERLSVTAEDVPVRVGPADLPGMFREGQILPFIGRWHERALADPADPGRVFILRGEVYGLDQESMLMHLRAVLDTFEVVDLDES